jgi:hypothetical protein
MRDLFFVTVEHERGLFAGKEAAPYHAFAFLAPARMIDIRIYVCVEAILVRCELIPECSWLLRHKLDFCQRFGALKSVLPWNDES